MKPTRPPFTALLLLAVVIGVATLAFGEPNESRRELANAPGWISAFPSTNFTVVGDGAQLINEVLNGNVDSIFLGASTITLSYPASLIVPKSRLVSVHAGSLSSRTTVFIKGAVFKVYGRVLFQNIDFVHSGEFVRYSFPQGHIHFSNCSFRLSQACSDGWIEKIPGQCIKIMSTPQTWESAFEMCKELGGQLLTVQTVLDHMAGPYGTSHWIGARRDYARFRQYRKLGWQPLYQTYQWCDFAEPLFLQPFASLINATDMLDCMALQYFALRPSDCEDLKPFICTKPRLSPRISNQDMLTTYSNNTFIPNSLFDFYHALNTRSLSDDFGKILLPKSNPQEFIDAAFPETIEIALTMTTNVSEVQIALDSVSQPNPPGVFSFHEANGLPTHIHVHTQMEGCIESLSVMFLDRIVFSFQATDYQHCDLTKHVIAFNSTCMSFNTDFTIDLTKLGTCEAVMSIWQHPALGQGYVLLVVASALEPVQARHDGILGVRNFEINGQISLDDLKDIRQLPDKLLVSSEPQCLIAIGIMKDIRTIRYALMVGAQGCDDSPCFQYLADFCLNYTLVQSVEVNLLSENSDNACFAIETITPREDVPLACFNSIAIVSTFAEFQAAASRLGTNNITQLTIQIRSATLTFEASVTVPSGTSLVIQTVSNPLLDPYSTLTVELRDVSLMVMPNAQLTITDATIPNGSIDVADDSALINIQKSTIYHSVRIGKPILTQGSQNTLIVLANPAPGEINIDHPLFFDEGKVFLNHSITLAEPLIFASKARISVRPLGELNSTYPSIGGSLILLLDDVQLDLIDLTLSEGTSVQIGEQARLSLIRVVLVKSNSTTILTGNGSLSIDSSTIEYPGSPSECGIIDMTTGILQIWSSTFDADIPDACLPETIEVANNVVRISDIGQIVRSNPSPSLLLDRGYLLYVQSDTRVTRLIPASHSNFTAQVVTSTGVNNRMRFEVNGLDMVQITATGDVCVKSFQLIRDSMMILEIPIALFENCTGVCSTANPTCNLFPSFNYVKAQSCIRLGPNFGFNLNLKLNADSCERLVLNPLRIEALTNASSYQLLMDETLLTTNNSNTTMPLLTRPFRRLQISGVNGTSMCFKSLQVVSSGITSTSVRAQDLKDCGISCGRITDQTNGCVNLNYVRYELAGGTDQCSRISVSTSDSCSQSTVGLTTSDLALLSQGLIATLQAELRDDSIATFSQIITLGPYQTLQISAGTQATVNASFIVNKGARLVLKNLAILGRIINLGGHVDLENTIFYAAPVHPATRGYLDGGSIFSSLAATVTATHVSFLQTQAPGNGGAVANTGMSQLTCNSCFFSRNEAAGLGKSIFNSAGSVVVLESCTFDTDSALFSESNGQMQLSNVQLLGVSSLVDVRSQPVVWEMIPNTLVPLFTFPDGLCATEGPFPTPVITSLDQCQKQCRTNATCNALSYTYSTQECAWCNFEGCRFNCTSDTDVFEAAPRYSFFSINMEGICVLNYTESSSLNSTVPSTVAIEDCQLWCGTYSQECAMFVFDETTSSCRLYRSVVFDTNCTTFGQPSTSSLSFPTTVNPTRFTLVGHGHFASTSSFLLAFENITVSGRCEALCIGHRRCSGYTLTGSGCSLFASNAFTLSSSGDPIFIRTTDETFPKLLYDSSFSISSFGSEAVDELPAVTDEACQRLCDAALSGCLAYVFKADTFRCIIISQRPRSMALTSDDVHGPYPLKLAVHRLTFEPLTVPLLLSSNLTDTSDISDTSNETEYEGLSDFNWTLQNFTLCELPNLKLNKTLAPGECRSICFAHDLCDSLVYDFESSTCDFYASPSIECSGTMITVNVTFQTLFQLTSTSLVPASHVVTACFKSSPLFHLGFTQIQSLEACQTFCDLFYPDCVGVSFDNESCELLESVFVTSAANCSLGVLSIALDAIQNSDSFLPLSSSYCLSGPRLAVLPGITRKECEKHCSSTFRTCGSFAYSLNNSCQLFSGGSYEPCFNIAATLNLASTSLGFSSFISYNDPAFVQPSPDDRPSEIIASTSINSTSWCIGLCTAYEECGAIRLSPNITECTLVSACGMDTYNCLSPQVDPDYFRPLLCPKQIHSYEIVQALRLEFCMALCKGRAGCQGFLFRVATKECEMLLESFELDSSDNSTCDVTSFYLQGSRPMIRMYDTLPSGILPQGSTLLNSTAASVESCLTQMCFKNGTRPASCSSFVFDLATGYCAVSSNQTLVLGTSTSPTLRGFVTRVFPFTVVQDVVITSFDLIRIFTGLDTVEKCSYLCDAIPSCESFAVSVLPSALNASVIDSTANASCSLFTTIPEYTTSTPDLLEVSTFDLYFRIPSSRFVSLGRSGKRLVAPSLSAVAFDTVGDVDFCLRLCEIVLGCKAVIRNPCTLYPDARYELDASLNQHPEIYISFATQTEYTLETRFLHLPNFASVPLPQEQFEIQASFMSTPGSSRLVFTDGTLHPFKVQLGGDSDAFQLVNACMYECIRTATSKVVVKWNNRYKDRQVSGVGITFSYPQPPNVCTRLPDASQCDFIFRNPSSDCGGANCVSSCGSPQATCQRDQTFTSYYCCSCRMLVDELYNCTNEGEPEFVNFEDYSYLTATPGCSRQVSVDATGENSCTKPVLVQNGGVLISPGQNAWSMLSQNPRLIQVKVEMQYSFEYYPLSSTPWAFLPAYAAKEFTRDYSKVRRGGSPMCLSSTTPMFDPSSSNTNGQLWSDPKGFPVINEYMQNCSLPAAQSSLSTYLTFQIFSASARLCLMLRPSLELAACSDDIRQQFYLDKDNTLRSASAPGSVIFSSVSWTIDGYIRIGTAQILFIPLGSTIVATVACPSPQTCPMLGHTIFVLPADYPASLADEIRDDPRENSAFQSSYTILKGSDAQTGQSRVENATSLDSCQQFCGGDCGAVEFERGSNSCIVITGASANIVQPSPAKEMAVSFLNLPYQRVVNVTYERVTAFLWNTTVSHLAQCYSLCDELLDCLSFTLDSNMTCRLYDVYPANLTSSTNGNMSTLDISLKVFTHTRRFPQLPSFFGYPDREIVSLVGLSPDECSVLCLSMSQCRLMAISNDTDGRPICRLNTRERTSRMQLQSRATGNCASLSNTALRTVVPKTCADNKLEMQYYYKDALFRVANQSSRCLVRNLVNDAISIGNCDFDLGRGGLDFLNESALFKLHNVSLNMFLSPVIGTQQNLSRCLKDDTSVYRTTSSCDQADSTLTFQSFNSTPSMYFTRPDALDQEIEDPGLILQLFLLSPKGQAGVDVLVKLQNLERKAQAVQRRLESATMRIEGIIEWMAYALIPIGAAAATVSVLDDALKPIQAAMSLAKKNRIVKTVLKTTKFDDFLDLVKGALSNADRLLGQVGTKVNKLMTPINAVQGMAIVLAGLIVPFASAEVFRQFIIVTVRAYECADNQGQTQTAEALLAVLEANERTIQSVNALMEDIDGLLVRVMDSLEVLRTTFVSSILPAINRFEQGLQPLKAALKKLDFVGDIMNMTIICLPNVSYDVVPQTFNTGTIFGSIHMDLPQLSMGGKSCIPLQFVCDGNLGISIAAVILSFVPGLGAIISFVIKLIVNLIKAFLLSIPMALAHGGQFEYDEDKCMACMVFDDPGGRCYKLDELDAFLEKAEKIVQEAFYPTFKFLFDSVDFAIQNSLGRFMPKMDLPLAELSIPGFDTLDSIERKLSEEVQKIEDQADATLALLESTFLNATLLPDGWDLECYLGPELEARFEGMLTDPSSILDETLVAAATVAIVSRGRPAPFSPSSLVQKLIRTRILPPWSTTLLPRQIVPAIVKMIGMKAFNRALGKGSPRDNSASSNKRSRNHQAMFDKVTKRNKLDTRKVLIPLMGIAVKVPSSTSPGLRRQLTDPVGNAFLDMSFAVWVVQSKVSSPPNPSSTPSTPRKSGHRILIKLESTILPDVVCASRAGPQNSDGTDADFLQLTRYFRFPVPGGLAQDQRVTLEFEIAAVTEETFKNKLKNPTRSCNGAAKDFCDGLLAICIDDIPDTEDDGKKVEKVKVAFDLISRSWQAGTKTGSVLVTRGPYERSSPPNADLMDDVPSLIEAAYTAVTRTATFLRPSSTASFTELTQRENYSSKLFSLLFGIQIKTSTASSIGAMISGTSDFSAWQQVKQIDFERTMAKVSLQYLTLGDMLSVDQNLEIRALDSNISPRSVTSAGDLFGFTVFGSGLVHILLNPDALETAYANTCRENLVTPQCVRQELTSTFVHEFSHLYLNAKDYVYLTGLPQLAAEAKYATFTKLLQLPEMASLATTTADFPRGILQLYATNQPKDQAEVAASVLPDNADSLGYFAVFREGAL